MEPKKLYTKEEERIVENIFLREENEKFKIGIIIRLQKEELFTYKCG